MAAPDFLVRLTEPWAALYGDSSVLPTLVVFGHVAALLFAGGLALALDRATLRTPPDAEDARTRQLGELRAAHRVVLFGLGLSAATGALLFASDVDAYFGSRIFWLKMALIALLLANGYSMQRAEALLRASGDNTGAPAWRSLRSASVRSIVLWFAIVLCGVALVNT